MRIKIEQKMEFQNADLFNLIKKIDKPLDLSRNSCKRKPKELFRPFLDDDKNYSNFLNKSNEDNRLKNIINFSKFNLIGFEDEKIFKKNNLSSLDFFSSSFVLPELNFKSIIKPLPSISPLSDSSTINSSNNSNNQTKNSFNFSSFLSNNENYEPINLSKKKVKNNFEEKLSTKRIKTDFVENLSTKLYSTIKIEKELNEKNLNKCCFCSQLFDQEKSLSKHIKSKHQALEDSSFKRLYKCNFCVLTFTRFDMLQRHNRKHTGEKPYECNICYRNFSRSDHLNTHRINHFGLKPYVCNLCPYASSRRDMVSRHLQTHSIAGKKLKAYVKTDFAAKQLCRQISTNKNEILSSIKLSKK